MTRLRVRLSRPAVSGVVAASVSGLIPVTGAHGGKSRDCRHSFNHAVREHRGRTKRRHFEGERAAKAAVRARASQDTLSATSDSRARRVARDHRIVTEGAGKLAP